MFLTQKSTLAVSFALAAVLWLAGVPTAAMAATTIIRGWTSDFAEPIIPAGSMRPQGLWNDVHVLKENNQYVMYLTTSVNDPFVPPILPFRAVSTDGVQWKLSPETPLIQASDTEFVSAETPSVVFFNGQYHMFFTGIYGDGASAPMAIGHATSPDGIHWTPDHNAVLKATGTPSDWNGYLVGEPGVVIHNNTMLVYFSAIAARAGGNPPQKQTIGVAQTTDGVNFTAPQVVLEQSSLYPPEQGYVGYSTPAAVEIGGQIHLFYDVAMFIKDGEPEWQQVGLHHAVSDTGLSGFVQDTQPLLTRDDFTWTSGEMLAPSPLYDNGELKLWFSGHVRNRDLGPLISRGIAGPEFGIGYVHKTWAAPAAAAPAAAAPQPAAAAAPATTTSAAPKRGLRRQR